MRRSIGIVFFSFLSVLPLKAEANPKAPICPSGKTYCAGCGCMDSCDSCHPHVHTLQKQENTVYSLKEGAVIKCEDNKTLVPLPVDKDGIPHWTCRSVQDQGK